MKVRDGRYFAYFALKLAKAGYRVIPIVPNDKRPAADNWSRREFVGTEHEWVDKPHGVGIVCGTGDWPIAAVDIDVSHPLLLDFALDWCRRNMGCTIERVGAAPRLLLPYRAADSGWRKVFSTSFFDPSDPLKPNGKTNNQRIEVLGLGQQFVALGMHPDTKTEYTWTDLDGGILSNPAFELPLVRSVQIEELIFQFERFGRSLPELAAGEAVAPKSWQNTLDQSVLGMDANEINEGDVGCVEGVTIDDARTALECLSPDISRDEGWIGVGMALHHQFAGDEEAFYVWDEWSAKSDKYPGNSELSKQWFSFGDARRMQNAPITYRYVMRLVAEVKKKRDDDEREGKLSDIVERVRVASTTKALFGEVLVYAVQQVGTDEIGMLAVREAIQDRYPKIAGKPLLVTTYKEMLAIAKRKAQSGDSVHIPRADQLDDWNERTPEWCRGWVYVAGENVFYSRRKRLKVSSEGFRFYHNHYLLKLGSKAPDAAAYVRDQALLPVVDSAVYWPGKPFVFKHDGHMLANIYSTFGAAKIPIESDEHGKWCARRVRDHISLMICGTRTVWNRECQLFVNFLRHNIEFPGEKIAWAILLQGDEGSGKTLFFHLMQGIMGSRNVGVTSGIQVMRAAETGFTAWAEGCALKFIEEIRLRGHNRHDVVNSLKDKLTNTVVEIVRKGRDPITVPNAMNYILLTNFKDAVPLDDGSRRYCVLFSRTPIRKLAIEESDYFELLFNAISERPGDIAKWILSEPYHPDFKPNGTAPHTKAREAAIQLGGDDVVEDIRDTIEYSDTPAVGPLVIVFDVLKSMVMHLATEDGRPVSSRCINDALIKMGYDKIGRTRLYGETQWLWAKVPDEIAHDGRSLIKWSLAVIAEREQMLNDVKAVEAEAAEAEARKRKKKSSGEPSADFKKIPFVGREVEEFDDEI